MATNKKITNVIKAGYQTYPGRTVESTVDNTSLLPGVHRTTRNKKYIDALLGELTSKGTLESFDGWVGTKSSQIRRKTDIYLSNDNRYTIGIKSKNVTGDLVDLSEELLYRENIHFKDAKQLISKSYGYAPGIDPDKFINFQNYYWLRFDLPEIALEAGYGGPDQPTGPVDVDINNIVNAAYYTTNVQANGRRLTLRNGMKIFFIQRTHGNWINSNNYLTPEGSAFPKYYIVSGVGSSIKLLPYELYYNPKSLISILSPIPWDKKNWDSTLWDTDILTPGGKQYVTIKTGSTNYNVWSRTNRWTHEQTALEVVRFLDIPIGSVLENTDRAIRPIIEFEPQLDLWNHGEFGKQSVALLTVNVSSLSNANGQINPIIDGVTLVENDRVIFSGGDPSIKDKTFIATNVSTGVNYVPATGDHLPGPGDTVLIEKGANRGVSYWFNGVAWVQAQQLTVRGQAPLFRLFDGNGHPIESYSTSIFNGSKIFGYKTGNIYDRELNFSISYDSNYKGNLINSIGAIEFFNYLSTTYQKPSLTPPSVQIDIPSFNYYRAWETWESDTLHSAWDYRSGWQPISQVYNVKKEHSLEVTESQLEAPFTSGSLKLIDEKWSFQPTYDWNISAGVASPDNVNNGSHKFLLEEVVTANEETGSTREWHDELLMARFSDNTIYNYTGRALKLKNQRGHLVVEYPGETIEIILPGSFFSTDPASTHGYPFGHIYPTDYLFKWQVGDSPWQMARIISRYVDDPRRPSIYRNGTQLTTYQWSVLHDNDMPALPVIGLHLGFHGNEDTRVGVGDLIDVVVNGSMSTVVDKNTEISNLSYNPYNEIVSTGAYGQFFGHFITSLSKRVLPGFVLDLHHQGEQTPRFVVDGHNHVFGDTDWQFAEEYFKYPVGHKIVLHDSPATRFLWASRSGNVGEAFTMLEDASKSYANFKLKFIQKIERLHLDQNISDIQATVDKALTDIFVGRNDTFRYAHSHMVMWGVPDAEKAYSFTSTLPVYECALPDGIELSEISADHVYVYYLKSHKDWEILTHTKDYEVVKESNVVRITFNFPAHGTPLSRQFKIRVFKKTRVSHVPPTPAKLGILPWYHPEIYYDNTYSNGGPFGFIQGHDGSLTRSWGDFRDDMLLEFERRVASSIGKERGERAENLLAKHWPRKNKKTWHNKSELNHGLEDFWIPWVQKISIARSENTGHQVGFPLTYNYSAFPTLVDQNTYGSWRDLYRHVYGTDRPNTHPWEMLGFARKPSWWDSRYSWIDPAKRTALILALKIGNRTDATLPTTNKSYFAHNFNVVSLPVPVDTSGVLLNPIQAGWYNSSEITANIEKTMEYWTFGDIGQHELAWRRTSDYGFAAAFWLILVGGPEYLEAVWEGPRLVSDSYSSGINVDRNQQKLVKWAYANQHRETSEDIIPGYGMLINEQAVSLNKDVLSEVIDETRNIKSYVQWTAQGFLDKNSLEFVGDLLIEQEKGNRIPVENYQVNLKITSPIIVLTYSGVKIVVPANEDGYLIRGYDNISTSFPYYPVNTLGRHIPVDTGAFTYKKYLVFEETLKYLEYGTVMPTKQDVINFLLGYGEYLKSQGWKFEDIAPTHDDILDWSYSAREFAIWSQISWQPDTQLTLSPASENLILEHDTRFFGALDATFLNRTYLLDDKGQRIDFKDTEVIREANQTTIKSRPGVGIYFVRCGLEEYTHVVTFDDVTIFNDRINDYVFGISIKRMQSQGKRTKNWDGRPNGNGYLIQNSTINLNLDTLTREIGDDYITVENRSVNPWIRNLKKSQLGITRLDSVFLKTGFNSNTIDQFQVASLRKKGSPIIVEKFTKGLLGDASQSELLKIGLPYKPDITIKENWMFRMGEDYGAVGEKRTWEIKLPENSREALLDRIIIRVIPPFKQDAYYETNVDYASDNIIDLLGPKDTRWVKCPEDFQLPLRTKSVQETDLPQAGIANKLETDYKLMRAEELLDIDVADEILNETSSTLSWDSRTAYDKEDQIRYKGQLYRALLSHSKQESFDPELWTAINEPMLPSIWLANKTTNSSDIRDWTVVQTMDRNLGIREICAGTFGDPTKILVEMESGVKHLLVPGMTVLILSTDERSLHGMHIVSEIRDTESFYIRTTSLILSVGTTSPNGKLFPLNHAHFHTIDEMKASIQNPAYEWQNGMKAYIDDRINQSLVYEFRGNYALFNSSNAELNSRSFVFYDINNHNYLHVFNEQAEEDMPWLFSLGVLLAAFDKLDKDELLLTDTCPISLAALAVPGPKVLPNTLPNITVANAINGIIFRQFNDCAFALAEKMYGSITLAVAEIKKLFDKHTSFAVAIKTNTTGIGTPLDLAKIATAIWSYVDYQPLFVANTWFFNGTIYESRNKLLDYDGYGLIMPANINALSGIQEYHTIGIKVYSGRTLLMVSMGYTNEIFRNSEAVAFLNTVNSFGSTSGVFNQLPFVFDRTFGDIVDHQYINNVEIVDYETNKVIATLTPYDPAAGVLPFDVDTLIDWKKHEDPAIYTHADQGDQIGYSVHPKFAWFDEHVGQMWWDLSAVRYLDYYQGTTSERAFNWGEQFPGSGINVHEWVRSSIAPSAWERAVISGGLVESEEVSGVPYHKIVNGERKYFWCEREERSSNGILKTYYYFWVAAIENTSRKQGVVPRLLSKETTETASNAPRTYSSGILTSFSGTKKMGVAYLAAIINNPQGSGIPWFAGLQGNAIMLQGVANFLGDNGAVLRIETKVNPDSHNQWLFLKEEDSTSIVSDWLHIRLRDSIIGTDQTEKRYYFTTYQNNHPYTKEQVVVYNNNYYRSFRDFLPADIVFGDGSPVPFISQPWQRIWNFVQSSLISISEIQGKDVPDYNRHPYTRYGNEIRPTQQSWLNDRIEAIRIFVDVANRELAKVNVVNINGWNNRLSKIIPTNDSTFNYEVSKYWEYIDFSESSFDKEKQPNLQILTSLSQLHLQDGNYISWRVKIGEYVKVLIGNEELITIWEKLSNGWKLVFQQKGTIRISKELFDLAKSQDLWDENPWDSTRWDRYPFVELFEIITALREDIFSNNYNVHYSSIFFALVREVMRQNPTCHWIRKSSYIDIKKINSEILSLNPYFRKEYSRDDGNVLVNFINEVKPYHTKVLGQIDVDQLIDHAGILADETRTGRIVMRYNRHGDQTWKGYHIDGHLFNRLQPGWDRNPWQYNYTGKGLLPASRAYATRLKQYLWDMPKQGYDALIDSIITGHSFGVQPEALQAIVDGNKFNQPEWDHWPEELASLDPGESLEIRVINNQLDNIVDANTVAWRYHYDILGGLTVYRYNTNAQTTVASNVTKTSVEIQLTDASILTRPDPVNGKPGVIWLAGERVEFWEIDGDTIKHLIRGTLGTSVMDHPLGCDAYDGGQKNQVPTPDKLQDWHNSLYPQWNELGQTLLNSDTREALFLKDERGYFVIS